ncbi:hypothetical protein HPY42_05470 [Coprothermobacteraceae bacterium]|nr:hypothetical protein [Coprothermobacteraceae bacterium]
MNNNKMDSLKYNYQCFGLRAEWVQDLLLRDAANRLTMLGPNQRIALAAYARHLELSARPYSQEVINVLRRLLEVSPDDAWAILFCNLATNSPLFRFYAQLPLGIHSSTELREAIKQSFNVSERTANNAVVSLLNTFAETPWGVGFGIGVVERINGRRFINKIGGFAYSVETVSYIVYKLASADLTSNETLGTDSLVSTIQLMLATDLGLIRRRMQEGSFLYPLVFNMLEPSASRGCVKFSTPCEVLRYLYEGRNESCCTRI